MITKHTFKEVLTILGFHETANGNFAKSYETLDCTIEVDFSGIGKITWPNGLVARDDTTSNLSANENFVVLECVDGLLRKGYRPEHIVLEEKWMLGHEQKGGKADVCVYDSDNSLLLIIECKTAGEEFRKFKKQLFADGGQLFSYWQQDRSAKWLCLYASDLIDGKIDHGNSIVVINCSDDPNMEKTAESDESVHLYRHAHSVEQLFQAWDETYNKQTCPDVIFGEDSQAYRIGIRRLHKKDLRQFSKDDAIVNRFEEILRHNNVSDKENAFNKLVSMFICKLVDEMSKGEDDELDFQYRVGSDTYENLQDRLQRLHRDGMQQFMDEKIFYVDSDYAEKLFAQYTKSERQRAIRDLQETIRKLKFFSNNDFAFKDVHNEELFLQNSKILVEMVQLFEPFRIVYPARDQLLGDLFELLLAKGFKQNEGQFFTAMPITRFIWESLPLERIIKRGGKMHHPRVIDYACGAGHFLTEGVEAVNAFYEAEGGKKTKDNSWVEKFIYGVEKDYRLARVSKVSLHMNGAGKGSIIFGDGLENYPEKGIEAGKFDVLVANPPYSVEAFKAHLRLKNNELRLLDMITDQGSEIEALFVERIAQLLKPGGVAAVVLPCSILTGPGPYVGARDVILNHFKIRAIVGLNKNAFQATSTETIILFLEKYDEPPRRCEMIIDSVEAILSGEKLDDWEDKEIFKAYLVQIGISEEDYVKFVKKSASWSDWRSHEYFGQYVKAFENAADIKALQTKGGFKKLSPNDQDAVLSERFYKMYLCSCGVEREKLQIFGMVYNQKTLIVKSPDDKNEERKFLGYSWSNRRGQEGIQIEKAGGMLYDDSQRRAPETIAAGIRESYADQVPVISQGDEYAKYVSTKEMIDFSKVKFDKAINLSCAEVVEIATIHPLEPLAEHVKIIRGVTYTKEDQVSEQTDKVILTADNISLTGEFVLQKKVYLRNDFEIDDEKMLKKGDCFICLSSGSRQHVGKSALIKDSEGYYAGGFMGILRADEKFIMQSYLAILLAADSYRKLFQLKSTGANIKNLSNEIGALQIPRPPMPVQQKIVAECKMLDDECEKQRKEIQECEKKIDALYAEVTKMEINENEWFEGKLEDILLELKDMGDKIPANTIQVKGSIAVVTQEEGVLVSGYTDKDVKAVTDLPIIVFGDHSCTFKYVDFEFVRGADGTQLLKFDAARFDCKFMCGYLSRMEIRNANSYERHMKYLKNAIVKIPPLELQLKILDNESQLESKICDAQKKIESIALKKAAILERYFKQKEA